MRVLHVIPATSPRYGGPSTAIRGMTEALAARGAEVTVVTTDADGAGSLDVPLDRAVDVGGVRYHYFRRSGGGEWKYSRPLARWLDGNVARFDVVHVHALFSYTTIPGCRAARRAGVPYVLRPLGTLDAWCLAQGRWKKAPYFWLIERPHLRHAAVIHATSEFEAQNIAALGYADRVRVIPLGVAAGAAAEAHRADRDGPLRLLFLSRLDPIKGLPLLLRAIRLAAQRAPLSLTIAGDGAPEFVRELRALASSLDLDGVVRFVGHLDGDAKRAALRDADLFVLPSHHENFGLAAVEAMASGLPAVLSDQVAIAPEVERAGAGVSLPLDEARFAEALVALAADRRRLAEMASAASSLARERYSWEAAGRSLLELYAAVQARGSAA